MTADDGDDDQARNKRRRMAKWEKAKGRRVKEQEREGREGNKRAGVERK